MPQIEAELTERVERLERQNRWLKIGAAVIAVVVLAAVLMGQAPEEKVIEADVVKAKEFKLVDDAGRLRGRWDMVQDSPALMLLNDAEKPRILLGTPHGVSGLALFDETGNIQAILGGGGRGPILNLSSDTGDISFAIVGSGPAIELSDADGNPLWRAP